MFLFLLLNLQPLLNLRRLLSLLMFLSLFLNLQSLLRLPFHSPASSLLDPVILHLHCSSSHRLITFFLVQILR
jgi:hypothetical protein